MPSPSFVSTPASGQYSGVNIFSVTVNAIPQGRYLLIAFGQNSGGVTVDSVTDSQGNTYSHLISFGGGAAITRVYGAYIATALVAGNVITVDLSSTTSGGYVVNQYADVAVSSPLDKSASSAGSGSPASSGNTAATAQAEEIAIGIFASNGSRTWTPQGGYTNAGEGLAPSNVHEVMVAYLVLSATGVQNASSAFSGGLGNAWGAAVITLKAGAPVYTDADTVYLDLVPSGIEGGPFADSDLVYVDLVPSGTDEYAAHVLSDAATVPLKFKIPEEDAAAVRLSLTPTSEDVGPFTDEGTAILKFTPFGAPGAIIDEASVRLALTPSGVDTFHQCKPRLSVTLVGWSIDPDYEHFWRNWIGGLEDRQWVASLLPVDAVVNHPC